MTRNPEAIEVTLSPSRGKIVRAFTVLRALEESLLRASHLLRVRDLETHPPTISVLTDELSGLLEGLRLDVQTLLEPELGTPPVARVCPTCGQHFAVQEKSSKVYCSVSCRRKAGDQKRAGSDRRRQQLREAQQRHREKRH